MFKNTVSEYSSLLPSILGTNGIINQSSIRLLCFLFSGIIFRVLRQSILRGLFWVLRRVWLILLCGLFMVLVGQRVSAQSDTPTATTTFIPLSTAFPGQTATPTFPFVTLTPAPVDDEGCPEGGVSADEVNALYQMSCRRCMNDYAGGGGGLIPTSVIPTGSPAPTRTKTSTPTVTPTSTENPAITWTPTTTATMTFTPSATPLGGEYYSVVHDFRTYTPAELGYIGFAHSSPSTANTCSLNHVPGQYLEALGNNCDLRLDSLPLLDYPATSVPLVGILTVAEHFWSGGINRIQVDPFNQFLFVGWSGGEDTGGLFQVYYDFWDSIDSPYPVGTPTQTPPAPLPHELDLNFSTSHGFGYVRYAFVQLYYDITVTPGALYTNTPTITPTITTTPTSTPIGAIDCTSPENYSPGNTSDPVVDFNPTIDLVMTECYRLLPIIDITLPGGAQLQFQGLDVCVEYYRLPALKIFGITISIAFVIIPIVAYLIRRLMTF